MMLMKLTVLKKTKKNSKKFVRSYARNISTLATNKTIYQDQSNENISIDEKTFGTYLNALERLYIVENVKAWSPNIRSSKPLEPQIKNNLSIQVLLLLHSVFLQKKLKNDFNTFGFFFESICTRDLRIYAETHGGQVYHYNDSLGLEIDLIIELPDGRWAGVEVKMGENEVDKASENLKKLSEDVIGLKPAFLMILTNTQLAYQRTRWCICCSNWMFKTINEFLRRDILMIIEKIRIQRIGSSIYELNALIYNHNNFYRYMLIPYAVENPKEPRNNLNAVFIVQKKAKNEQWEDLDTLQINKLKVGEWAKNRTSICCSINHG